MQLLVSLLLLLLAACSVRARRNDGLGASTLPSKALDGVMATQPIVYTKEAEADRVLR